MKIFDFHTHPGYDFHNDELGYVITPEIFVEGVKRSGVDRFAGCVIHKADMNRPMEEYEEITRRLNREAMEFYRMYPDMYVPGIHVHPRFPEMSAAEIEKHHKNGFKLVGELVPYLYGWGSYSEPELIEIMRVAERLDMVVNIHYLNAPTIFELAEACPHLTLVVAHLDGYGGYDTQIELMKKYDNVFFDISAHGASRAGMLRDAIDAVGRERILLGSDYPGYNQMPFINSVLAEGITDGEREAVMYKNAERLLGL